MPQPRGIGYGNAPTGCFVCACQAGELLNELAILVETKELGEKLASCFQYGARLDFREHEPSWIQVKVSACDEHIIPLEALRRTIGVLS